MKVREIYKLTKSWIFEKQGSTNFDDQIIDITNKVLAELYEQNNMCRMFYGKVPFIDGIAPHLVHNLDDEVDFEEEFQLEIIPKGIDANLLLDDDLSKKAIYDVEYNNAQVSHQKMVSNERVKRLTEEAYDVC